MFQSPERTVVGWVYRAHWESNSVTSVDRPSNDTCGLCVWWDNKHVPWFLWGTKARPHEATMGLEASQRTEKDLEQQATTVIWKCWRSNTNQTHLRQGRDVPWIASSRSPWLRSCLRTDKISPSWVQWRNEFLWRNEFRIYTSSPSL